MDDPPHWRVIDLVSGQVNAFPVLRGNADSSSVRLLCGKVKPGSETEALQQAGQADPGVDLKYLRIHHEDSLKPPTDSEPAVNSGWE